MRAGAFLLSLVPVVLAGAAPAMDSADLYAKASPAVLSLRTFDGSGVKKSDATGFVVDHGWLVTNHHVAEGADRIEAVTSTKSVVHASALLFMSRENDLAVLRLDDEGLPRLELRRDDPRVGERLAVIGNPLGLAGTLSEGIVSAFRKDGVDDERAPELKGVPLLQTNASISPGSSGSPLVDQEGRVIGVAAFTLLHGQNVNFAIPASTVRTALDRIDVARPLRTYSKSGPSVLRNLLISLLVLGTAGLLLWRSTRPRRSPDIVPKEGPFARRMPPP